MPWLICSLPAASTSTLRSTTTQAQKFITPHVSAELPCRQSLSSLMTNQTAPARVLQRRGRPAETQHTFAHPTPLAYIAVEFIETPIFSREIDRLLSESEYRRLQVALLLRPDRGDLIRGSGGLRKLRWRTPGHGKRGGLRIIYYWVVPDQIYLLYAYPKSRRDDLTQAEIKTLKALMEDWLQ